MKFVACFILLSTSFLYSQQSVDSAFDFQSEANKKYSLYIPSDYDANSPHQLMLGFHPLNTNRWDAQSWRDTLINFAELNSLLLVCPDGGLDGRVDDDIDTAFTSVLLDSVMHWYNVDEANMYIMGFSWGGKTTYSYGLRRTNKFRGYMPIGAAINGVSEFESVVANAENEAFYLIHGTQDAPETRYSPMFERLEQEGACIQGRLLLGVGHTIDFPIRDTILSEGFRWLKEQNCELSSMNDARALSFTVNPNPASDKLNLTFDEDIPQGEIKIYNYSGNLVLKSEMVKTLHVGDLESGILLFTC